LSLSVTTQDDALFKGLNGFCKAQLILQYALMKQFSIRFFLFPYNLFLNLGMVNLSIPDMVFWKYLKNQDWRKKRPVICLI
jgi:hypothetical protein